MSLEFRIEKIIAYIETHMEENIDLDDLNKIVYMSKSSFYVIFKTLLGTSVKDYIRKRRLSLSGYDLIYSDASILEIALKYQYQTSESFSRAFKKHLGMSPTNYRLKSQYIEYYPAISMSFSQMLANQQGGFMLKPFLDKNKIAEEITSKESGYILDIDLDKFERINMDYSYAIGDQVLIETANRINAALQKNNTNLPVTRIGGDEFIVILENVTESHAKKTARTILDAFATPMIFKDTVISITVSIGMSKFQRNSNPKVVIDQAFDAVLKAKDEGRHRLEISE